MKQDISGDVLTRALEDIRLVLTEVKRQLPLGPMNVQMTSRELEQEAAKGGTLGVANFQDMLSSSQIMRLLEDVKAKQGQPESKQALEPSQTRDQVPIRPPKVRRQLGPRASQLPKTKPGLHENNQPPTEREKVNGTFAPSKGQRTVTPPTAR